MNLLELVWKYHFYQCNQIQYVPYYSQYDSPKILSVSVDLEDPSNNHLDIEWYTDGLEVPFYDWTMAEFHLNDNDSCFTYSVWDSNGNDTTTAENFKSTARVVDVMNFYGLKVYDHAQIEEMIFSKAEDIGGLGLVSTNIDDIILVK